MRGAHYNPHGGQFIHGNADPDIARMVEIFGGLPEASRDLLDKACYNRHKPKAYIDGQPRPVIGRPNPQARICILGRDPGEREVENGAPFVGDTGDGLRSLLAESGIDPDRDVYWANTVPYKRGNNDPWPMAVQSAFYAPTLQLLSTRWRGHDVITLGEETFKWFRLGTHPAKPWDSRWHIADRFGPKTFHEVTLNLPGGGDKVFAIHPLPHPSTHSAKLAREFPALLGARLSEAPLKWVAAPDRSS